MGFQAASVIILLVFYGCYFVKMINQKKRGIDTNQLGKETVGFPKFIELATKAASFIVPVAEVVSIVTNTTRLPGWARVVGVCLGFAGAAVFVVSVVTMRDSWRAGVPKKDETKLVTDGIYRISRNPAFLGFDLVYLGILLAFFSPVLLAISAFAALMFHLQIVNVEEEFLLAAFGESYREYKGQVNRYLGRKLRRQS